MKEHPVKKLLVILAMLSGAAMATPIDDYELNSRTAMLTCRTSFKAAQTVAEARKVDLVPNEVLVKASDFRKCITEQKAALKPAYEKAAASLRKASAKAALKEHYIATLTAIQGVEPQSEELQIKYLDRQSRNETKVSEQWTRFEAEQ